jgi:hypothetical protein
MGNQKVARPHKLHGAIGEARMRDAAITHRFEGPKCELVVQLVCEANQYNVATCLLAFFFWLFHFRYWIVCILNEERWDWVKAHVLGEDAMV